VDPACKGHLLAGMSSSELSTGMRFVHCAPP
jgi:hypothetical protein